MCPSFISSPERLALPLTSMGLKRGSWIFRHSHLFHDGVKVGVASAADRIGGLPNLNALTPGHTVGVLIDDKSSLHLLIDGEDQGLSLISVCSLFLSFFLSFVF